MIICTPCSAVFDVPHASLPPSFPHGFSQFRRGRQADALLHPLTSPALRDAPRWFGAEGRSGKRRNGGCGLSGPTALRAVLRWSAFLGYRGGNIPHLSLTSFQSLPVCGGAMPHRWSGVPLLRLGVSLFHILHHRSRLGNVFLKLVTEFRLHSFQEDR